MKIADTIAQCCTLEKATHKILVERLVASCEEHSDGGVSSAALEDDEDSPTSSRYDTNTTTTNCLSFHRIFLFLSTFFSLTQASFSLFFLILIVSRISIHLRATRFQFFNLAPGLGDMMELMSKDLDDDHTRDLQNEARQYNITNVPSSSSYGTNQGLKKKPTGSNGANGKGKRKIIRAEEEEEEENDDEDDDEDDDSVDTVKENVKETAVKNRTSKPVKILPPAPPVTTSNRPSRSSKALAATKIAMQLTEQNDTVPEMI